MKVIIHDLSQNYNEILKSRCERVFYANGQYAPCQGCFGCWTKHPAKCYIKDTLQYACRIIGEADELVIITENCYGQYSPAVKNFLDRSIGTSTPMSTYRGKQMHHTLRYGKKQGTIYVYVYGDISEKEKKTFEYTVKRNALNEGFENYKICFTENAEDIKL